MKRPQVRSIQLALILVAGVAFDVSADVVELATATLNPTSNDLQQVEPVQFTQAPLQPPATAPTVPPPALAPPLSGPLQQDVLPTTPGLPINQLAPPQPNAFQGAGLATLPAGFGATLGSFSSSPNMIGDLFGGGFSFLSGSQTVTFADYAAGEIISGTDGSPSAVLAFEFGTDSAPNDIFTSGTGLDLAGLENAADTFQILEPIPPSDALTSPGPGFVFDGGTAVYTNNTTSTTAQPGTFTDGQQWYIVYSYTNTINGGANGGNNFPGAARDFIPVPGPGVSARRIKISENFSPEVRDRFFTNYNFFNDAYGGLGDISRYILGFERILVEDLISIEARLPMAGTYGSFQEIDRPERRNFELGNATVIAKAVLLRTNRFLLSGGTGVTMPTADDTSLTIGNREILRIDNRTVHLLPFIGAIQRLGDRTSLQSYLQLDIAANGDPVLANLTGGPLENLGTFTDSTLLYADVAASHRVYQNRRAKFLRSANVSGEIHYTGTLQASDIVTTSGLTYTNLKRNFNVVNTTVGMHFQLGDRLVVSPAIAAPLRTGLDRQFDYEAIVQANYYR